MDDVDGEVMLIREDVVEGRRDGGMGQDKAKEKVFVTEVREERTWRRVRSWGMGRVVELGSVMLEFVG